MKKYHLITYGCQMNKSDSERLNFWLQKNNFKPTTINQAELVILNLCSVRQSAIDRVWGVFKNIKIQEYKNKKKIFIILTGCILDEDKKKFKDKVHAILDINDLPKWPEKLGLKDSHIHSHKFASKFACDPMRQSKFQAYVPIMTGCNNFCSYCVVPYTRGREYSRPPEEIINEVYKLVIQGYKFITLLGQNVNSYKSRINTNNLQMTTNKNSRAFVNNSYQFAKITFPQLLRLLNAIPGNFWLSFVTSHPKDLSDELIKCFKECKHLIPYLHLPIQSGSDKILKKMNRKYTAKKYLDLIKKVRQQIPNISISTDIIVGFPNETKADFNQTAKIMQQVKFDMAYIAQYSPRAGTAAFNLKDDVPKQEKKRREKVLTDILKKTALENNKKLIGKTVDVLVEKSSVKSRSKSPEVAIYGKTAGFKHVKIILGVRDKGLACLPARQGIRNLIGQFVKVKITKANAWGLEGTLTSTRLFP